MSSSNNNNNTLEQGRENLGGAVATTPTVTQSHSSSTAPNQELSQQEHPVESVPSASSSSPSSLSYVSQFQAAQRQQQEESSIRAKNQLHPSLGQRCHDWMIQWGCEDWKLATAGGAALLAFVTSPPGRLVTRWLLQQLWWIGGTILGTAVGVGLGLGLATHVYDQLQDWEQTQRQSKSQAKQSQATSTFAVTASATSNSQRNMQRSTSMLTLTTSTPTAATVLQDQQTYHSLMVSAGYHSPRFLIAATAAATDHTHASNNTNPNLLPLTTTLRGQVLRQLPANPLYRFQTSAFQGFRELWPTMHPAIQQQLGQAVEYILRDFVGIWYWKMDSSLINPNSPPPPPPQGTATTTGESNNPDSTSPPTQQLPQQQQQTPTPPRHMLYSVAPYKPIPFLDALYESCTMVFGNLALRVEHNVNVPQLILLQWTQILAHTFKWYRTLRKAVLVKQQMHQQHAQHSAHLGAAAPQQPQQHQQLPVGAPRNKSHSNKTALSLRQSLRETLRSGTTSVTATTTTTTTTTTTHDDTHSHTATTETSSSHNKTSFVPVSEMAMTKEFLFAGKLHRAVTFGLDVPSLLFADMHGRECGHPAAAGSTTSNKNNNNDENNNNNSDNDNDDAVLAARLWQTDLIRECELDYNRVVGHRMVRALTLRQDFGCRIVASMLTEILGGCVLTPIMGLFTPEYLNSWLIAGLDKSSTEDTTATAAAAGEPTTTAATRADGTTEKVEDPFDVAAAEHGAVEMELTMTPAPATSAAVGVVEPTTTIHHPPAAIEPENHHRDTATTSTMSPADAVTTTATSTVVAPSSSSASPTLLSVEENITAALTLALMDLQRYLDVEELSAAAAARESATTATTSTTSNSNSVDWDHPGCRSAVVRLVLVLEAALTHGRCTYHHPKEIQQQEQSANNTSLLETEDDGEDLNSIVTESDDVHHHHNTNNNNDDANEQPVEITLPEYESANLTQILMEITSDIEAFEERIELENNDPDSDTATSHTLQKHLDGLVPEPYQPTSSEQSTLRTLIAAWLHTGQVYRTLSALVQAKDTILAPYYDSKAYLRSLEHARGFVRQLRKLSGIDIMVDTMAVLASPRLEEISVADLSALVQRSTSTAATLSPKRSSVANATASAALATPMLSTMASTLLLSSSSNTSATPRYLDFHRNESFAASLRSERERRRHSWERLVEDGGGGGVTEGVPMICRASNNEVHADLHHLARIFYAGTNLMALRDAARRRSGVGGSAVGEASVDTTGEDGGGVPVSLIVVETACPRRRIEVPDDDSSFLLRAQPRPLNAVGVHRDQRQHEQSFKCFTATYEEPALPVGSDHFSGGRYIRRCLVRYYPIDRTASIALQTDPRRLDQRKHKSSVPDTITLDQQSSRQTPFLSTEFLKERHLCQRWIPRGTTRSQSLLASSVMEPTDFTATPRTGKALDFVYRCSLYERPMLDLGGKHFTVHDSSALGVHRADASALELSDASLSAALLTLGQADDDCISTGGEGGGEGNVKFEFDKDGYPVLWMKFSRSKQDDTRVEVKPYRTSFVRAALMITSARQEAQQSCLIKCVKAGSAKKATKALIDTYLRRTQRLVEYAGSSSREKESTLLRDLKLGVNHIDRSQLRRNALLSPRYPTELLDLTASVEDAVQSTDVKGVDIFGTATTVFKIKVSATIALAATDEEMRGDAGYLTADGSLAKTYGEEWVVYRSLKEFQTFHKHLKNEVSFAESSGTAGSRLVGAAAAAFAATTAAQHRSRQRKMLIPSLSQASKTGALGITKNVILKRKELLAGYLAYLLSPGHLLGRCSELLLFLGAAFPLPPAVRVGETIDGTTDPLGRTNMTRTVLQQRIQPKPEEPALPVPRQNSRENFNGSDDFQDDDDFLEDDDESDQFRKSERMIPVVRNKIDKVPLAQVRKQLFELLRYQFGFENASFVRNRMLAALKTASFAVTSGAEFKKKLYQLHVKHVNSEAVAGLIEMLCGIIWPEGIFFESKPPTTEEELQRQAQKSKELLHSSFPDQVRAILGQELTRDGIEIFHEMLQNRMVVKSMAYMFFDLLWVEVFPELGDVMPCGAALDIDS